MRAKTIVRTPWLLCALLLLPLPASAQGSPERMFGLGTYVSGGYYMAKSGDIKRDTPALVLLDLELEIPFSRTMALQLWVPVLNIALFNSADNSKGAFWMQGFFKMYIGGENEGLFVAPGAGFWYLSSGDTECVLFDVAARAGWEFSTAGRGFGFTLSVRPWLDIIAPTAGSGDTALGFGVLAEAGFHFYLTR
ncbi:MAG: hypothetical protein GYA21_12535 [Myxococcales bacterium]|nr:hypothetical protein [Myxococcales bacterium]